MARQKAITGPDEEIIIEGEESSRNVNVFDGAFDDITELLNSDQKSFDTVMEEFGEAEHETVFKIKVYRVQKDKGRNAWLFDCQPSELPILNRLRDEYGGGTFEIRMYANKKLIKKPVVDVEAPKAPVISQVPKNDNTAELVKMMLEEMRANQVNSIPPAKPVLNMEVIAGGLAAVVPAVKILKELFSPQPVQGPNNFDSLLGVLKQGIELGKISSSDSGGDENLYGMLKTAMSTFGPTLAKASETMFEHQNQVQPNQTQQLSSQQTNQQLPSKPTDQPQPEQNSMNVFFRSQLHFLVQQAKQGNDPYPYACMIADNVPEEQIKSFISDPGALQRLEAFNPEVTNHRDWFMDLRESINEALTEEGEPANTGLANEQINSDGDKKNVESGGSERVERSEIDEVGRAQEDRSTDT